MEHARFLGSDAFLRHCESLVATDCSGASYKVRCVKAYSKTYKNQLPCEATAGGTANERRKTKQQKKASPRGTVEVSRPGCVRVQKQSYNIRKLRSTAKSRSLAATCLPT